MDDCSSFFVPSCCFMLIQHIWAIESLTTSHQQHWFRFLPLGCTFIFLTPSIFRSVGRPAACVRLTMTPIWPASSCSTATTRLASPFIKHWEATALYWSGKLENILIIYFGTVPFYISASERRRWGIRGNHVVWKYRSRCFWCPSLAAFPVRIGNYVDLLQRCRFIDHLASQQQYGRKKKSQILLKHKTVWLQSCPNVNCRKDMSGQTTGRNKKTCSYIDKSVWRENNWKILLVHFL